MSDQETSNQEASKKKFSFDWTLWLKWILVSTLGWVIGWAFLGEPTVGAVVGIAQWIVLRTMIRRHAWWIPASAVGWAIGWALRVTLLPPENSILAESIIGASIGVAQWLVLRGQVPLAWWWIVLSTLGWTIGLTGTLGFSWTGAVAGAATGVGLEFMMRFHRPETHIDG